ncbi:probable phospholipid hydroperoxide glutathione peroxidase [Eucalyptus grandis]|uniref:probable phospholipid hydroperoxide glutathione peroxidase n=1 Tax=Eucalyptus grandis TaxID=71139 RepID=UPI00192ED677|nr:probable phospholipid hydroperoxide glutathione peroxidase [Eucalyptus grandis]
MLCSSTKALLLRCRNLRAPLASSSPSSSALPFPIPFSPSVAQQTLLSPRPISSLPAPGPPIKPPPPFGCRSFVSRDRRSSRAMASQSSKGSIYDFTVKDARGNDVDLGSYKGKVLLIVNVASQCGLTNSNYTELSQVYEKYKNQGLEILAFPCNQFGAQEPGTNEQIVEFACTRFKAEYPIFDKVDVNGENADPLYKFLKSSKGGLFGDNIKWNFSKFLIDKEGNVVDRYAPTTSPLSIEKDIKKLLGVA